MLRHKSKPYIFSSPFMKTFKMLWIRKPQTRTNATCLFNLYLMQLPVRFGRFPEITKNTRAKFCSVLFLSEKSGHVFYCAFGPHFTFGPQCTFGPHCTFGPRCTFGPKCILGLLYKSVSCTSCTSGLR